MAPAFVIREAREDDWPQIWPIIHDVIAEQQTFAYDPAMSEDDAKRGWLLPAPASGKSGSLPLHCVSGRLLTVSD